MHQTGPVISFLPILLMGILFGLAMDYEVFLVSRMREEYVHAVAKAGSKDLVDPQQTIEDGFNASARVVVAAGMIMFAVFAAFVPEGEGPIKTIAFGLAVGVFVDAFIVRMTLVPAVMKLLGHRAWWLPTWIDKRLPTFDVEGEGLAHQLSLRDWPTADDDHLVYAEGLRVPGNEGDLGMALRPGEVVVVDGQVNSGKTAFLLTLAGRMRLAGGRAKIAGLVLPEQAAAVRGRVALIDCRDLSPARDGQGGLRQDLRTRAAAAGPGRDHGRPRRRADRRRRPGRPGQPDRGDRRLGVPSAADRGPGPCPDRRPDPYAVPAPHAGSGPRPGRQPAD